MRSTRARGAPMPVCRRTIPRPFSAARQVFGNPSFRPRQRDIVQAALRGRDCFVLMPTGGGKSLTYQVRLLLLLLMMMMCDGFGGRRWMMWHRAAPKPSVCTWHCMHLCALMWDWFAPCRTPCLPRPVQLPAVLTRGVTVVVTPLLSLMQDQVQALNSLPCGGVPTTYISSQQSKGEAQVRSWWAPRLRVFPYCAGLLHKHRRRRDAGARARPSNCVEGSFADRRAQPRTGAQHPPRAG